jgi:PEGA domain
MMLRDLSHIRRACVVLAALGLLTGCMSRHISVTSEPVGATVTVNDVELGRTPLQADFTYYGVYDVLVTMPGYEPLRTKARANAPVYEFPPFDALANAVPANIDTQVRWHFTLQPALERASDRATFEQGLLDRANTLREKTAN